MYLFFDSVTFWYQMDSWIFTLYFWVVIKYYAISFIAVLPMEILSFASSLSLASTHCCLFSWLFYQLLTFWH
jgi:hypothetical protein